MIIETVWYFFKEFSSSSRDREFDLHGVIISSYYGSCVRDSTSRAYITHHVHTVDETPLLNAARPLKAGKCINARIFSLGMLFIGGVTIGGYLLYMQGLFFI